MGLINDFIFQKDAYVNIRGVEIDRDKQKFVIRLNIYNKKGGNKYYLKDGDEYRVNKRVLIEGVRDAVMKNNDFSHIEKQVRSDIKAENKKRRQEKLATISIETAKQMIKYAIDNEAAKKMKVIGENEFNNIFNNLEINLFKFSYDYLKKIGKFKNAKNA